MQLSDTAVVALIVGGALLPVAVVLWFGWLAKAPGSGLPQARGQAPSKAEMRRHVVWYMFYANPNDPRVWVEKPYGIGWTINVRTRRNAFIAIALALGGLLAVAIGMVALLAWL